MSIERILFIVVLIGVVVYCVNNYVTMDGNFKKLFNVVAIVATLIWLYKVLIVGHNLLP